MRQALISAAINLALLNDLTAEDALDWQVDTWGENPTYTRQMNAVLSTAAKRAKIIDAIESEVETLRANWGG